MASTPSPFLDDALTVQDVRCIIPPDLAGFRSLNARFLVFDNLLSETPSRIYTARMTEESEVDTVPSFQCPLPSGLQTGAKGLFNLSDGLVSIPSDYDWAFFQGEDIRRACHFSVLFSPTASDHAELIVDIKIYQSSALVAFQVLVFIFMYQAPVVGSVVASIMFAGMGEKTAAIISGAGLAILPHYLAAFWIGVLHWITSPVQLYQQVRLGTFVRRVGGSGAWAWERLQELLIEYDVTLPTSEGLFPLTPLRPTQQPIV